MTCVILPPKKYAEYYGNIHVGEHHLAHVRHSCWCQVSTGFLIIRSRCLHGFMCDKTALLVKIS